MTVRFPTPLRRGDTIGVTSPSSGVPEALRPRLDFCVKYLNDRGFVVVIGDCMDGAGVVSASAAQRGDELGAMLTDPAIRAVVPPWGGDLAVELLPHLDLAAIGSSEPTWFIGNSDISTLLLAITMVTGTATLHGQNLLDTPYRVPDPLLSWIDVVTRETNRSFLQGASVRHRVTGHDRWEDDPTVIDYTLDTAGSWRLLRPGQGEIQVSGRLVGGCIETVSVLAGTSYGDLNAFARDHAPEGLMLYLEAAEDGAVNITRDLWRMRLAGWFGRVNAVLIGRTLAPNAVGFTQQDALRSAFDGLDVPIILDVDCGHVPPQLALVNGALAELSLDDSGAKLTQHLR